MEDYASNYEEVEDVESYAKLEGPTLKGFIHKLTVYLGREPNTENFEDINEQSIFIGDSQKISRRHAKIFWNNDKREWEIQILSKNKAVINGVPLRCTDNPLALFPMDAIKIDKYKFYFFPASASN